MSSTCMRLALLLLTTLSGCTVGPDYQRPIVPIPDQWSQPAVVGSQAATAEASANLAQWWRAFDDPTLDALIEAALAENLDLKSAVARVREARAARAISAAGLYPALGANASYEYARPFSENSQIGSLAPPDILTVDLYQAAFDASWELDIFGGIRRGVEAADADLAATEDDERDVRVTLLAEVARAYVSIRSLERRLAIAHANADTQSGSLALTEDRFRSGLASKLDVTQARSLLATTEAQIPVLERERELTLHALSVLLGRAPDALQTVLAAKASLPGSGESDALAVRIPVGLPSDLLRRRPDIRRAERRVAAATARSGVATAELFPKFTLMGLAGLESIHPGDFFTVGSRYFQAGPGMSWRLFEGGRTRAEIEVRDAQTEEALRQYEQAILTGLKDVEDALVAYGKDRARRTALVDAVAADRESVALAEDLYVHGLGTYLNVLVAERSQYASEEALVQVEQMLIVDLIATYKALGGGWEATADEVASR